MQLVSSDVTILHWGMFLPVAHWQWRGVNWYSKTKEVVIIRTQVFQKHVTLLCFISINSNTGPHMIYLQKSGKFDTANKSETVSFVWFLCVWVFCSVLSDCRDNKASEQKQVHGLLSAAPLMLHHQGPVLNLPGLNNSQSHSNRWTDIKHCRLLWAAAAAPFITTSSSMLPQLDVRCSYR